MDSLFNTNIIDWDEFDTIRRSLKAVRPETVPCVPEAEDYGYAKFRKKNNALVAASSCCRVVSRGRK